MKINEGGSVSEVTINVKNALSALCYLCDKYTNGRGVMLSLSKGGQINLHTNMLLLAGV